MTATSKRAIVIIGCAVALLTVLALALPAASRIVESTTHVTKVLPTDLSALALDAGAGDVTIRAAGPGETPGAEATIRSGLTDPEVTSEATGSSAELVSACGGWWWWDNCSVEWEIVVPADAELAISNDVGAVTITETTAPLTIASGVGSISAHGISSPTVLASSSVGDVDLEFVTPPDAVEVTSSTGDVTVTVPDDGTDYRVETDTSIGEVRSQIGLDPEGAHRIEVRSSVGDIILQRS